MKILKDQGLKFTWNRGRQIGSWRKEHNLDWFLKQTFVLTVGLTALIIIIAYLITKML